MGINKPSNHPDNRHPEAGKINSAGVPAARFFEATNLMESSAFELYLCATRSTKAGDAVAYLQTRAMGTEAGARRQVALHPTARSFFA